MCDKKFNSFTNKDLLIEINKRGLLTESKTNQQILSEIDNIENFQIILTKGISEDYLECRECKKFLKSNYFSYYLSRVDKYGYLMRSNAICNFCKKPIDSDRNIVLSKVDKSTKPKKGSVCPNCNRVWSNNWHRHHVGNEFIGWWCGECNMRHADQRNKI